MSDIFEQFNIKKDFKFNNADHQRQYSELLRKVERSVKARAFEALNDDVGFLELVTEFLDTVTSFLKTEDSSERNSNAWSYDQLLELAKTQVLHPSPELWLTDRFDIYDDHIERSGDFDFSGVHSIETLAPNLTVNGRLMHYGCKNLTAIPENLTVERYANFSDCQLVEHIPSNMRIRGDFYMKNCPKLKSIPFGMSFPRDVNFVGCTGLESLPHDLIVGETLYLDDNVSETVKDEADTLVEFKQVKRVRYDS
ncbi:hypothetical protein COT97_00965 [Candidatus Falkowbacteria bacterium CG10_big_fil_rev_8_21_14_0_10_39_11]|uniref:Leucine-rich repeat domain-containing protein n=1 Tax=Candidatus Falkowbacteria bacterium CG10_big_fil_rev_8_21_14_0_10_39_11 TaxID=1974565 RepID=A0A2H0V824_9BACT|nr:MAG: hypothetical protein COT97_00965 [Candidatus Falkowbacteria bacterium CG10_big_fil_rev_8_21_14_0_10_39_11]